MTFWNGNFGGSKIVNELRKTFLAGFFAAWETVVDLPLSRSSLSARPPRWAAACFPLLGVVFGGAVLIAGDLCGFFFNPVAGAVIFALAGTVLWELRDSGRGSRLLATCLGECFRGTAWQEALENASSSPDGITIQPAAPIYWIGLAARFLILFALGRSGAGSWLIVIWICGFSLQGMLALESAGPEKQPIFPGGEQGHRALLGMLILSGVCFFLQFPTGTLAAGALYYFACRKGRDLLAGDPDAVNDRIALISAGAEQFWLLLGLLLAL